jgi:sarcosine oxidase
MNDGTFDVIVIGVGGMGSAAVFELARRGRRVLGLEQLPLGHDLGSSHGHTRIIRKAYYEDPDYVPLVARAYQRWYDLEQREGRHLLTECPCLSIGPPASAMIQGVLRSAAEHALPVEKFDGAALRNLYPPFRFGPEHVGVLERTAGFLYVDDCVQAHARQALQLGAAIHENEPVVSWQAEAGGVTVQTRGRRYTADRLVLTAGPWAGQLLGRHGRRLTVMRQVVFWIGTRDDAHFRRDVFPVWIAETPEGHFYGLPALDANGLKIARHYGAPELPDPSAVERSVSAADEEPVRTFLRTHLPDADGPRRRAAVCLYTLTPDRHFLLDVHPDHPNVVFAAGFSGHGFKFASVVGEVLADLAEKGRTDLPVARFRLARFADSGD